MEIYIVAFGITFVYVFLKAWQQLNVMKKRYAEASIVPFFMALCEVTTIGLIVTSDFWVFIPIGFGGSLGVLLSMKVNHR
jgi:uncharacterized protein YebE (UPF0316 family)